MTRAGARCLFSAPVEFMPDIKGSYGATLPTDFVEAWYPRELPAGDEYDVWIVNPGQHFVVDAGILERFPRLSRIVTPSTGRNHIDLKACEARQVVVRGLLDRREALEDIAASSEFTFLLLLNSLKRMDRGAAEVTARRWRERDETLRGFELQGKTVGLVGMGRIGRRMARYCEAFGASVVYFDPNVAAGPGKRVTLEEVFSLAHVVCICCSYSPETHGMIGSVLLDRLQANARLVNTSRGEVLREAELAAFLSARPDVGFAADVVAGEVTNSHFSSPLMRFHDSGQAVITPHIAGITVDSMRKAAMIALDLVKEGLEAKV